MLQHKSQGILLLINGVLAIEDEDFMQGDRFQGRLQAPFLAKILWLKKGEEMAAVPPIGSGSTIIGTMGSLCGNFGHRWQKMQKLVNMLNIRLW